MEKTAKEMFEELGYVFKCDKDKIQFISESKEWRFRKITFYLEDEDFSCSLYQNDRDNQNLVGGCMIDMKLNKAIQQQLKELGWE